MHFTNFYSSSAGNLYQIREGKDRLLIECGVPEAKLLAAINYDMEHIHGCVVSHRHRDHCHSPKKLMDLGIPVYGAAEDHRLCYRLKTDQRIGPFHVHTFDCVHDVPCKGFIISTAKDRLLFAIDTARFPQVQVPCDIVAVELNHSVSVLDSMVASGKMDERVAERIKRTHASDEKCFEFLNTLDLTKCREIHLLHLSKNIDYKRRFDDFFYPIEIKINGGSNGKE